MFSLDYLIAIVLNLGPYFGVAFLLAFLLAIFVPWGYSNPQKWYFFYIVPLCLFVPGGDTGGDGSLYKQITWGALYVMTALILYNSRTKTPAEQKTAIPWEVWLLMAFTLASTFWSPTPATSLKRYILLGGMLLIALLASRIALQKGALSDFMGPGLTAFLLLGGLVAIAFPGFAFDGGALRGFASHKNSWGQFCLLCLIIFTDQVLQGRRRWWYLLLATITAVMLVLAKSSTSLVSGALAVLLLVAFHTLNQRSLVGTLVLITLCISSAIGTLVFTVLNGELPTETLVENLFALTDRSTTLTGRTQLWMLMWNEITHHPWLGLGYGGFWTGKEGISGYLTRQLDWGPPTQAHSGYLDMVNEIGFIGVTLVALVLLRHLWRCVQVWRGGEAHTASLHLVLVLSFLIHNYAESSIMLGTSLNFIVIICSVLEIRQLQAQLHQRKKLKSKTHPSHHTPSTAGSSALTMPPRNPAPTRPVAVF